MLHYVSNCLSAICCWAGSLQWVFRTFFAENSCLLRQKVTLWERSQRTKTVKLRGGQQTCPFCGILLLEQAVLDVLQHGDQPFLHLSLWNCHLCARVSPHCDTLTLLHIFWTHFQTDRNSLNKRHGQTQWEREKATVIINAFTTIVAVGTCWLFILLSSFFNVSYCWIYAFR